MGSLTIHEWSVEIGLGNKFADFDNGFFFFSQVTCGRAGNLTWNVFLVEEYFEWFMIEMVGARMEENEWSRIGMYEC